MQVLGSPTLNGSRETAPGLGNRGSGETQWPLLRFRSDGERQKAALRSHPVRAAQGVPAGNGGRLPQPQPALHGKGVALACFTLCMEPTENGLTKLSGMSKTCFGREKEQKHDKGNDKAAKRKGTRT